MTPAGTTSLRYVLTLTALTVVVLALAVACLLLGSVSIDARSVFDILMGRGSDNVAWEIIVLQSRLPMIVTAALAGAALSVAGLLLQTTFNNPLAGPSILGVSTGAGLGVAVVMLALGGSVGTIMGHNVGTYVATLFGALLGAGVVLVLLIAMSAIVRSATMLLIVGILISYLASSIISLLNSVASEEGVHSYVAWGFGNFQGVSLDQLPLYCSLIVIALVATMLMVKPLNALLLGTRYAQNLGVDTHRTRNVLLLVTGVLTAVVTAYCGPIGFVGLVVPHIARLLLGTSNHSRLLPATMLAGAAVTLLCTLLSVNGPHGVIPINAITPIIGVPIIIYIIVNRHRIQYFN
ncbi:MAG: iron ABC transporter permease [Muribaculaceae bacterium]|nr:iron ABC transporter permease [Muribaculaceae bacterium]MBQ2483820.1 iron ABC transporter permease [Muribaculaceae bacterium]